jgi:hypothetical protein
MSIAGVFLIQRLEGSRFGTVVLWVFNSGVDGESWAEMRSDCQQASESVLVRAFTRAVGHAAGGAGTRVGLALEGAAKS